MTSAARCSEAQTATFDEPTGAAVKRRGATPNIFEEKGIVKERRGVARELEALVCLRGYSAHATGNSESISRGVGAIGKPSGSVCIAVGVCAASVSTETQASRSRFRVSKVLSCSVG